MALIPWATMCILQTLFFYAIKPDSPNPMSTNLTTSGLGRNIGTQRSCSVMKSRNADGILRRRFTYLRSEAEILCSRSAVSRAVDVSNPVLQQLSYSLPHPGLSSIFSPTYLTSLS